LSVGSDGGWPADEGVADGARVGCHTVLARQPPPRFHPTHARTVLQPFPSMSSSSRLRLVFISRD